LPDICIPRDGRQYILAGKAKDCIHLRPLGVNLEEANGSVLRGAEGIARYQLDVEVAAAHEAHTLNMPDGQLEHGQHLGHDAVVLVVRLHRWQQCDEDQLPPGTQTPVIGHGKAGKVLDQFGALRLVRVLGLWRLEAVLIGPDSNAGHSAHGFGIVEPGCARKEMSLQQAEDQEQAQSLASLGHLGRRGCPPVRLYILGVFFVISFVCLSSVALCH